MRQLNRLNQYHRLWQPSQGATQQVTISELAARCFCSERHVRTLLRQAQEAGWLSWRAQSGRGKRGELTFHVAPESLRNAMMEEALKSGQQHNALELAQLAPEALRSLLHPFLGGQWQNDTPTLRIPYYRSLEPLQPGFLPGRAEQHLAGEVFSGLTRFNGNSSEPTGDLAHHWDVSADGLRWHFYIRSTVHWHNGDKIENAATPAKSDSAVDASCPAHSVSERLMYRNNASTVSDVYAASTGLLAAAQAGNLL